MTVGADPAVRVSVPASWAEVAGAVLIDMLGPYQELGEGERRHLLFYPFRHGAGFVPDERIMAALPSDPALARAVSIERVLVPGGWEEGWKVHFRPVRIGRLYVRPPWEAPPPVEPGGALHEIILTPGLAFGTGLHPTTRGVLALLQDVPPGGPLLDAGTGSGILAIAAAKLGYAPVRALDNDPLAVEAARVNGAANGVALDVRLQGVEEVPREWAAGATVLANLTLEPVRGLLRRLSALEAEVTRVITAGILAGEQEAEAVAEAGAAGLVPVRRLYEAEWVTLDLRPAVDDTRPSAAVSVADDSGAPSGAAPPATGG
ncbi:MAG: 50S ribosomal protein L11 methyltransferase [Actinobacteria bacterium]|nr:50S ribosomal protein L11 methyltransferase [Actinomycetota bacterium]